MPGARGGGGVTCVVASAASRVGVIGGAGGGMLPAVAKLSMDSFPWRVFTSVRREADALQSSGMRCALRSVMSKRVVFAAFSALAQTPVS
jgi:hypothetical protein